MGTTALAFNADLTPDGVVTNDGAQVTALLADLEAQLSEATELAS